MRYGTKEQKRKWLRPLMDGEIRSAFLMTEPAVASSDATNIETRIEKRRRSLRHQRPQMVVVGRRRSPLQDRDPDGQDRSEARRATSSSRRSWCRSTPPASRSRRCCRCSASTMRRTATPRCCWRTSAFPPENILLGEGRGFEIAQGRLGPGRIHHCMRTIGKAEEALEKMVKRLSSRTAFGKKIIEHSIWEQRIAEARTDIEMNRLLCLKAADMMDKVGNKTAQLEIAMIKVAAPNMALKIIDNAIQAYGGAGVSDEAGLARDYASHAHACAWRTVRTRSITAPLPDLNFGSMQTPLRTNGNAHDGAPQSQEETEGASSWRTASGKTKNFRAPRAVEERHRIDEARLDGWMREHVEGYQGPLTVLQFKGGQSNPTYRLDTPGRSYVMRRKPFGKLLPSAHAVDREFRVIAALEQAGLSGREGLCAVHRRRRDRRRLLHHVDGRGPGVLGSHAAEPDAGQRGARSSPARSRRWRNCTSSIRKRSGSAISASPAIISRARSIAGPSNTARPRPSTFRNSRSSPSGCRRPCRSRSAFRSSTATTASTT